MSKDWNVYLAQTEREWLPPRQKQAPSLHTERLALRAHRIEDFAHCKALWSDPVVTRYTVGVPLTPEDVWSRMVRYAGHWPLLGYGYWVVEEKSTGTFLGEVGFADLKRSIDPPLGNIPEAGWVFAAFAHGKGFASEAVEQIHIWARAHLRTQLTACIIHPENTRSLRLATKLGYRETAQGTYRGRPTIILHRSLLESKSQGTKTVHAMKERVS